MAVFWASSLLSTLRPPPQAAPTESAAQAATSEELTKEGLELRRAGKDAEALPKFQQAYEALPSPRHAAQYGLCLQALARWADADTLLGEAISATKDPWIQKNRGLLKEASETAKAHIGRVEIIGSPEGAAVAVNGRQMGTLPLADAIKVNEGSIDIEVTAPGMQSGSRTINVAGASYQSVVFRLKPQTAPTVEAASAPSTNSGMDLTASSRQEEPEPIYHKAWFWGAVGAVVVAAGVTALLLTASTEYPKVDQKGGWQQ